MTFTALALAIGPISVVGSEGLPAFTNRGTYTRSGGDTGLSGINVFEEI